MMQGANNQVKTEHALLSGAQVSQATIKDLPDLIDLFEQYRAFYKKEPQPTQAKEFLEQRVALNDSTIFIAREVSGKAVGFTQLYPTFSSLSMQRVWILNDLFVVPEARGLQVGHTLLTQAEQYAKDTGAKGLVLETAPDNTTARKLYEAHGWQIEDTFLRYGKSVEK